jgi:hypothetical protein
MRKVILQEFVTLDGLAAGPNDSVDFVPASTKGDQSFAREQTTLLEGGRELGREDAVTFQRRLPLTS